MFAAQVFDYFKDHLKDTNYNYLEIGVFNGDSIALLADAYKEKDIIGVDPFIEDGNTTGHSKVEQGYSMITQRNNTMSLISQRSNIRFFERMRYSKDT